MDMNRNFNYKVHAVGDVKEGVSLTSKVVGAIAIILDSLDLDVQLPDDMSVADKVLYIICHKEVVININNSHNANHIDVMICFLYHDASLTQPINDVLQKLVDMTLSAVSLDIKTERLVSGYNS